jgi:hypothetical protein
MTSTELYPQFRAAFPTGVSHDIRVTNPLPLVMAHGQEACKWDVDGEQVHDLVLTPRRESSTLRPRVCGDGLCHPLSNTRRAVVSSQREGAPLNWRPSAVADAGNGRRQGPCVR